MEAEEVAATPVEELLSEEKQRGWNNSSIDISKSTRKKSETSAFVRSNRNSMRIQHKVKQLRSMSLQNII